MELQILMYRGPKTHTLSKCIESVVGLVNFCDEAGTCLKKGAGEND